jgi:hypothetical protein
MTRVMRARIAFRARMLAVDFGLASTALARARISLSASLDRR